MNELTRAMQQYRQCLMVIWNGFLAVQGDWDERGYFSNAAVELFRAIVLYYFVDEVRDSEILPSHRGDKELFTPLRVKAAERDEIKMSMDGSFADTRELGEEIDLGQIDMRYFDLYDFYEVGFREFKYVKVEIVASPIAEQVGVRLLIPFENAWFEHASPEMKITLSDQRP